VSEEALRLILARRAPPLSGTEIEAILREYRPELEAHVRRAVDAALEGTGPRPESRSRKHVT